MKRHLDPVSGIGPEDQRNRPFPAAADSINIIHGDKQQSIRVMVAIAVVFQILLDCRNLKFSDPRPGRWRQAALFLPFSAQGQQALLWLSIDPDDAPKPQPYIVHTAGIIEVIPRLVGFIDAEVKGFRYPDGLSGHNRGIGVGDLLLPGHPHNVERVLLFVGAIQQADHQLIAGVGLQNGSSRIPIGSG